VSGCSSCSDAKYRLSVQQILRLQARLDTIQLQLDETTKQLRDLRLQQQQLQTRNILLEKIAQLSKEQTSDDYLAWQVCDSVATCQI